MPHVKTTDKHAPAHSAGASRTSARRSARAPRPEHHARMAAALATKIVPDTSVIIEGMVSRKIMAKEIRPSVIIIHEAVMSELESQANQGRETGYLGIEEIKRLRTLISAHKFQLQFTGKRPTEFEIRRAKTGEIDSLIRALAQQEKATLVTADKVQALVAEAKGIDVVLFEFPKERAPLMLESFFDPATMSVHLRENVVPVAKRGMPGKWEFVQVRKEPLTRDEVETIGKQIVEEANFSEDGFIELQRKGSTIVQLGNYRIVITRPPLADGHEITAVRPVKKLVLSDYKMSEKLLKRISEQAEGVLLAGSPGMGKSTFAQALAEFYASHKKIVKTVETPRDMQLSDEITQYSISHGSSAEIHDILLLTRPDYTIFDEMRNTEDFRLFADLRLSGVGMVGVVHATNPIDAVQRFLGRIELGVIPQVIDTVVFIRNGAVHKVFSVKMTVKVPSGMTEADLARPVVTVDDFETGKPEFEMYSYGEETVVIPVTTMAANPLFTLAAKSIEQEFHKYAERAKVEMVSGNKCVVYVPEYAISSIIGRQGQHIQEIEDRLGLSIQIKDLSEYSSDHHSSPAPHSSPAYHSRSSSGPSPRAEEGYTLADAVGGKGAVQFEAEVSKKKVTLSLPGKYTNQSVHLYIGDDYLLTAKASKEGVIAVKKNNKFGKMIAEAVQAKALRIVRG